MVSYKTYLHRHTRVRLCNQELGDTERGVDRGGTDSRCCQRGGTARRHANESHHFQDIAGAMMLSS
eukprot:7083550-Prymnesium_polylepis.1